jgi:hypothetical protein
MENSQTKPEEPEFSLSESESQLLEEFGVLLAAEYGYTQS